MQVMSIALGGCLKAPPIAFGLTNDTGGHIAYVWGAAAALADRTDIDGVEIVTRLIEDPRLGPEYAQRVEQVHEKLKITRIATDNRAYLSKEDAEHDLPHFIDRLCRELEAREMLPDIVHAHFADAAMVAVALRDRFGIPFLYTSHSLGIDKRDCIGALDDCDSRVALEDRAIAQADAIIASSRDEAERQLMRYPSADAARIYRVAPGAVMVETTADASSAKRLIAPFLRHPDRPILLAIARPVAKKNLSGLVRMYAADATLRSHCNLVILAGLRDGPGSGEAEQRAVMRELLDLMDEHDLYGSFALPKRHDQRDISALYALARNSGGIFVNPALNEPYGLTLTEAAYHGLPVVATCHGGAPDIVSEIGHGIAADPCEPVAFTRALHALLFDQNRWNDASRAGSDRARGLTWGAYAESFIEVASRVLAPKRLSAKIPARDLILSDIDHTLTGCRIGAREFVDHLSQTSGRMFGIATGRSLQEARRILADWHYPDPAVWITSVGSEIYWQDGAQLRADTQYAAYLNDTWDAAAVEAVAASFPELKPQAAVEQRRFKRSWFAPDADSAMRVRDRLEREGVKARVIFSHGRFLDILPMRAGKSGAMRWVADILGLPLDAVFAAGDSGNDLDMLEACPNGIMVANHSAELAPLIGRPGIYVARRPHAGGIVEILEKLSAARSIAVAA